MLLNVAKLLNVFRVVARAFWGMLVMATGLLSHAAGTRTPHGGGNGCMEATSMTESMSPHDPVPASVKLARATFLSSVTD